MNYSKEIGETLAETLNELFVIDEMGIPLNEIRDLATLKGHLKSAEERYGVKHPKYKALQNLHAKKEAAEARKADRMTRIKTRQEFHAKRYGYKPVAGSKRNQWVHSGTGHTLNFGDGRSWSHMKSGGKRAKGGNATPIRDLRRHLAKLHEDVELQGEPLQEIRHINVLGKLASQALLATDPQKRQELQRVLALKKRKWNLGRMAEDEVQETMGRHQTTKKAGDPTFSKEWSGVSHAPHCKGAGCPSCGTQMHHEGGSHYCPSCDDYKGKPQNCKYM